MQAYDIVEQGSDEWHRQRLGKVTGSRVADATAKTKTGWGAARGHYAIQLCAERLTGQWTDGYTTAAMQWGIDVEPHARAAYTAFTGWEVDRFSFVDHPTIEYSGYSPDGFVLEDGLVEVKCPLTATHIRSLLGEAIDPDYIKQMQWGMACTGRQWCDFVSFDPRLPQELQLSIQRVDRDDAVIKQLEDDIRTFLLEVDAKMAVLKSIAGIEGDWPTQLSIAA